MRKKMPAKAILRAHRINRRPQMKQTIGLSPRDFLSNSRPIKGNSSRVLLVVGLMV
jgi:hypothetical protein